MIYRMRAECIDCRTRYNISPHLFGFWICNICSIKRAINLLEGFLKQEHWTDEERKSIQKDLERLKKELSEAEKHAEE